VTRPGRRNGKQLAFISAENGTSADVYLYTPATDQMTRLTTGDSQSAEVSWSPDGKYIFNVAVTGFGTGAGEMVAGVWVVTPAGRTSTCMILIPTRSRGRSDSWRTHQHSSAGNTWRDGRASIPSWHIPGTPFVGVTDCVPTTLKQGSRSFTLTAALPNWLLIQSIKLPCCRMNTGGREVGTYFAPGTSQAYRLVSQADNITWSSQAQIFIVQIGNLAQAFHPMAARQICPSR